MNRDGRKRVFTQLRVAAAAIALLLAWLSPALRSMADEPDVCGMECCVAEGHCCCAARKHFVKGHVPGADGRPAVSEKEVRASCPLRCAQPPSGFHHLQFSKAAVAKYTGEVYLARSIYAQTPRFASDALADGQAPPRAPPPAIL